MIGVASLCAFGNVIFHYVFCFCVGGVVCNLCWRWIEHHWHMDRSQICGWSFVDVHVCVVGVGVDVGVVVESGVVDHDG